MVHLSSQLILEHFHYPVSPKSFVPSAHPSDPAITPPLTSQATTNLLLVSIDFPVLGISSKYNRVVYGLWCLVFLMWGDVFRVHPCCVMYQNFIFYGWLCSVVLIGHISSSIYQLMDRGCFLLWAAINLAPWTYKCLCRCVFPFLWGIDLGGEWSDHMVALCLAIWGMVRLFSKVTVPFYFYLGQ